MKIKKRVVFLAAVCAAAMLLLLSGCKEAATQSDLLSIDRKDPQISEVEASPAEEVLQKDLLNSSDVEFYDISTIEEFSVDKSDTSEDGKDYEAYVSLAGINDDGTYRLAGEYTMSYRLQDEGWKLEKITPKAGNNVVPLVGSDFTKNDLIKVLDSQGYTGLVNLSVYEQKTDLDSGVDVYFLTVDEVHKYVTYHKDLAVSFVFNPVACVWDQTYCSVEENDLVEEWNLSGKVIGNEEVSYTIEYFNGMLFHYSKEGEETEYGAVASANNGVGNRIGTEEGTLIAAFGQEIIDKNSGKTVVDLYLQDYYIPRITNIQWSDITDLTLHPDQLLIGPDHIYAEIRPNRDFINDEEGTLDFSVQYELFPLDSAEE